MTNEEYTRKLESYMSSDAPIEIKGKAIDTLNDLYFGVKQRAMKIIEESAPEIPKGD